MLGGEEKGGDLRGDQGKDRDREEDQDYNDNNKADPFHFGLPDPGSNKSAKIMENAHKNQQLWITEYAFHKQRHTELVI